MRIWLPASQPAVLLLVVLNAYKVYLTTSTVFLNLCDILCLQCFTMPGYGRSEARAADGKVTYAGQPCPMGSYNVGGSTGSCQACPRGLTTAANGAASAADCSKCSNSLPGVQLPAGPGIKDVCWCEIACSFVLIHCLAVSYNKPLY